VKFTLRQLFFAFIGATIAIYLGHSTWTVINGNYDEISKGFYAHPQICDVKIWTIGEGIADLATDVTRVEFSIVGRPHSRIAISTPKPTIFESVDSIALSRIENIDVAAGYFNNATGLRAWGSVDVGPASELRGVLPCTVRTLDELIENYDKFLVEFSKWPTADHVGVINVSPTRRIEYRATPWR
jgi:hypothetical protein